MLQALGPGTTNMVAIPDQTVNDFKPLPGRYLFGTFITQESADMFTIEFPLLRLVIGNVVKFAEARVPEVSILLVLVLDQATALRLYRATFVC